MQIIETLYDNIGICRAIIRSDSGNEYCTCIDPENFRAWCSCPFYIFNPKRVCKHITFLMNNVEFDKMTKKEDLKYIETECKAIDTMLGGGVPTGIVTAVFGEPTVGKTIFTKQAGLASIAKTGKNTILVETEGLRDYDTKLLLYRFMGRYNLDKDTVDKKFIIKHTLGDMQLQSIQKLLQMFGYMVTYEISKNGKYSIAFQNCTPTITDKELKETGMIIIDSLTKPVKDSVGSETQNLPSRAQLTERLFGKLYHFAKIYDVAIMVIHHASVNPITPFGRDLGKPYGGDPILYNSKYAIQFIDAPRKLKDETTWGEECRRIKLLRRPDEPTTGELIPVRLRKDWGFCDS
jgi:RecA/RadA recombinase